MYKVFQIVVILLLPGRVTGTGVITGTGLTRSEVVRAGVTGGGIVIRSCEEV